MTVERNPATEPTGEEDEWSRTKLFMRRPRLDDLPAPPPLPEGYLLRRYEPGDLAGLAALLTRSFDDAWDERRVREALTEAPEVDAVSVIAHADGLVATASAYVTEDVPESGYLHYVGTDPVHRGKGLGAAVSLAVLRRFQEMGLRDAVLETQDFRLPAVRAYLRLGFVPEARDEGEQRRWTCLLPRLGR